MSYIPEEDSEREKIDLLCRDNVRADYNILQVSKEIAKEYKLNAKPTNTEKN